MKSRFMRDFLWDFVRFEFVVSSVDYLRKMIVKQNIEFIFFIQIIR